MAKIIIPVVTLTVTAFAAGSFGTMIKKVTPLFAPVKR